MTSLCRSGCNPVHLSRALGRPVHRVLCNCRIPTATGMPFLEGLVWLLHPHAADSTYHVAVAPGLAALCSSYPTLPAGYRDALPTEKVVAADPPRSSSSCSLVQPAPPDPPPGIGMPYLQKHSSNWNLKPLVCRPGIARLCAHHGWRRPA